MDSVFSSYISNVGIDFSSNNRPSSSDTVILNGGIHYDKFRVNYRITYDRNAWMINPSKAICKSLEFKIKNDITIVFFMVVDELQSSRINNPEVFKEILNWLLENINSGTNMKTE